MKKCWVIPPQKNADFVCCMEDILDLYQRPYNRLFPLICMDESSTHLVEEEREAILMKRGSVRKEDYQYSVTESRNLFLAFEPLQGKRYVKVTQTRTKKDWASFMQEILEIYREAKKIILVMDNLNTHKLNSFYETFPPKLARELASRLEVHYTPKHGSWLNMAEIEFSALKRQCLSERSDHEDLLKKKIIYWQMDRNRKSKGSVDWRFTTQDARIKLAKLYPSV